jgi:signal transduction histidine kinase
MLGYTVALTLQNKILIQQASSQLAKVFQRLNKFQEANFYLNQSITYKDSLQIEENARRTNELEFNYLLEKKQNEITLLEKDKSIQLAKGRYQYLITAGLMVMIVFLATFVFFIQKSKRSEIQAKDLILQQKQVLEKQAKDLEELNTYKNKIFSILSHDIRNPISSLNQVVELINEEVLTVEDFKHIKDRLHAQLKSINILLDNLLNWSKNQLEGELLPNKREINLSDLINQNISLFNEFTKQKQLTIANSVPNDFLVWFDPNHLEVALRNILFNAIKFSFPKGKIEISAEKSEGEILISISDTGKGMDEIELSSLFSYNKKPGVYGTKGERGAGIGLILTKEFVSKNDGKILVQSKVNEGSTFKLVFPDLI